MIELGVIALGLFLAFIVLFTLKSISSVDHKNTVPIKTNSH